jgi:predicted permease
VPLRSRLRSLWRNVAHSDRVERDLDNELNASLDLLVDEEMLRGATPAEARRAARLQLGQIASIKTQVRDGRGGAGIESLWHDVRFSLRQLVRSRSFTAAVVLSLALGMGANGAIFGLLNALRLRSLPVVDASELAEIRLNGPRCCRHTGRNRQMSLPLWQEISRQQERFSSLFAFADTRFNLAPQGEVRYVEGLYVSGSFFPVLGVPAERGRMLTPADDRPGCANAPAVISHALWQREFGGADDILSRTLTLRSGFHQIVGVVPAMFLGVEVGRRFDVALPVCASGFDRRDHWWLAVMGRLASGGTMSGAEAHLATLGPSLLQAAMPPNYTPEQARDFQSLRFSVHPAANGISPLRAQYEDPLWLLLGIAALVFLTACANVASLSVVRATARQRELALRVALGATRFRIVRQLVIEGALIGLAGAFAGIGLAGMAIPAVVAALSTSTDPIVLDVAPDWRIILLHVAAVGLTTLAFAAGPVFLASRRAHTQDGARSTDSRPVAVRELLVSLQVAMSVVLVSAALLFASTFRNLRGMDLGFTQQPILVANVFLAEQDHPPLTRAGFQRDLIKRLAAVPGVAAIASTTTPPLGGSTWGIVVRSRPIADEIVGEGVRNQISKDYFAAMEMPVVCGRSFDDRDTPQSPKVAVVNEAFARRFFPAAAPLGQRFMDGDDEFEVIGLVRDSKQYFLREDFRPISYTAASQVAAPPSSTMRFVIRSQIGTAAITDAVRRTITGASPSAGIRFAAMTDQTAQSVGREQLMATLSVFFGLTALALAIVGVYGVVSYTAASRQREIGIRLALGARAAHVVRTVLARLAVTSGVGLVTGAIATASVSTTAASFLYGVEPRDPRILTLTMGVVLIAALAATVIPVRRALATDPVRALKAD